MRVVCTQVPRVRRLLFVFASVLVVALFRGGGPEHHPSAQGCDPTLQNEIVCENPLPGAPPSEWQVTGAGDSSIQGFATDISVNRGQRVFFKIDSPTAAYRIDIYRLGFYGGMGARKVATANFAGEVPQNQPNCLSNANTGLVDCGNWANSSSWLVPANAVSGLYIARPVRFDTGGASHIPFIVRDDSGGSELLFQTSDTTWQAYNRYGGNSLYTGSSGAAGCRCAGSCARRSSGRPRRSAGPSARSSSTWRRLSSVLMRRNSSWESLRSLRHRCCTYVGIEPRPCDR